MRSKPPATTNNSSLRGPRATALFTSAALSGLSMPYLDHLSSAATHLTTGRRGPMLHATHPNDAPTIWPAQDCSSEAPAPMAAAPRISADVCAIRLPAKHGRVESGATVDAEVAAGEGL